MSHSPVTRQKCRSCGSVSVTDSPDSEARRTVPRRSLVLRRQSFPLRCTSPHRRRIQRASVASRLLRSTPTSGKLLPLPSRLLRPTNERSRCWSNSYPICAASGACDGAVSGLYNRKCRPPAKREERQRPPDTRPRCPASSSRRAEAVPDATVRRLCPIRPRRQRNDAARSRREAA